MWRPVLTKRLAHLLGIGACFTATAILYWQLRHPVIRFYWPIVNAGLWFGLMLALPWLADLLLYRLGTPSARVASIAVAVSLVIYSCCLLPFALLTAVSIRLDRDLSFDRFSEMPWKGSTVRLYRLDGGATTDYGVLIRHELAILPGVYVVRNLDSFYHCYSINLAATKTGVRADAKGCYCTEFTDRQRNYRLQRFIYF
jgi:hypothetical protein